MKKIVIYLSMVLGALGLSACESYDECPPLNEGYLINYIMPEGVFLSEADWAVVEAEDAEYEAFLNTVKASVSSDNDDSSR